MQLYMIKDSKIANILFRRTQPLQTNEEASENYYNFLKMLKRIKLYM